MYVVHNFNPFFGNPAQPEGGRTVSRPSLRAATHGALAAKTHVLQSKSMGISTSRWNRIFQKYYFSKKHGQNTVTGRDVVPNVPDLFGSRDARAFEAEAPRGQ